jgi:FKBP-type peptidyl-prolyl cis-trans isomerase FklB
MKKSIIFLSVIFALAACKPKGDANLPKSAPLANFIDSVSYSIGVNMGMSMKQADADLKPGKLYEGMQDVLKGGEVYLDENATRRILVSFQYEQSKKAQGQLPEEQESEVNMDTLSYAIGCDLARNMQKNEMELSPDQVFLGLKEFLGEKGAKLTEEDTRKVISVFQQQLVEKQSAIRAKQGKENIEKGTKFLEENKSKEGVMVTESGLQYKVIESGAKTGPNPTLQDRVKVHYKGTLIDGTQFDSSYERGEPAEFMTAGVIQGWIEALQLMRPGDHWELYIPEGLAYGENAPPTIGPNQTLIFDVTLLEIMPQTEGEMPPGE